MIENVQEIDLQSTRSEKERKQLEQIRQKNKLTDEQNSKLLQMKTQVDRELETNADFQGQNRIKATDVKNLLRMLLAREFKFDKALEMWRNWMYWRKKYDVDNINLDLIDSELKSGKAFWHKYDKEGNPCCIMLLKNHISAETNNDKVMRYMIYLVEIGIKMAEKSGTDKLSILWDREGFSAKNFDLNFISLMKGLLAMFQDNYAERLAHVFILYPSFLMKQAFNIFKPFLAEKVRSKIRIIDNLSDLQGYFEETSILKIHGGKSEFEYNYPDRILADPLQAVLPYFKQQGQQQSRHQSFSFQNQNENEDQVNQEIHERSSCFFSIENDSTEFFNFQNSQGEDDEVDGSQSQSSKFQEQDFQANKRASLNQEKNGNLNQEYEIQQDNDIDYIKEKSPQKLKYGQVQYEENQVVSSGCCSCKSGSTCNIF